MKAAQVLSRTLKALRVPVARLIYKGKATTYFTFKLVISVPVAHADDENTARESTWLIDLFSKEDYTDLLGKAEKALKRAGFYAVILEAEQYEEKTELHHITLQAKFTEE